MSTEKQKQWSCPICGSFRVEHTCTIPQAWERIRHLHSQRQV